MMYNTYANLSSPKRQYMAPRTVISVSRRGRKDAEVMVEMHTVYPIDGSISAPQRALREQRTYQCTQRRSDNVC